jgi:hypothetical protein
LLLLVLLSSIETLSLHALGFVPSEYPTFMSVSSFSLLALIRSASNWMSPFGKTAMTVLPPYAK